MNLGRFAAAVIGVWVVRSALNTMFYGGILAKHFEEKRAAYPGIFREVIPGFIGTDLIFAVFFVLLFALVGAALGGGVPAGVKLGLIVAILSPVLGDLYMYFGVTYMSAGEAAADSVFQIVAHAIQGVVAGVIYKQPFPAGESRRTATA